MRISTLTLLAAILAASATWPTNGRAASAADAPAADATAAATPAAETPTADEIFAQGRDALYEGHYDQAIDLLKKAVAADPTKANYRLHLARAYRYAGKDDEAVEPLQEILKTTPDHVEAGQMLGEIFSAAKRYKDVVDVLEPLLKYRHDYLTYHMLAEAQSNLGDQEKARKSYEEAIKLNPNSATDHYRLGNIYLSSNLFALAANAYEQALALGQQGPILHYKLGSAYFNLRNYFGRIAVRTVRSGKPGTIDGDWYLIEPVAGSKDAFRCAPEASAIYQVARAVADGIEDRPDIHVLRATIYLNARRYDQAYEIFSQIGADVPDADKALFYYYYAQAALGIERYDRYLELLNEAIKLDPAAYKTTLVDAYLKVADQHNQSGELDKYIEYLAAAVAESPETASLHLKLGDAYAEAQKPTLAAAQWQMVLDLEPEHPRRMKLIDQIQRDRAAASVAPSETATPPADGQ